MSLNTTDKSNHEYDSDHSIDDEQASEEETAFERRLTKSLSKLMRKEL